MLRGGTGKFSAAGLAPSHHNNINMAAFKKNQMSSFQRPGNNLLSMSQTGLRNSHGSRS